MFQSRILARLMRASLRRPPRRILELGCGDGRLSLAVARRLSGAWPGVRLTLVDAQPVVADTMREEGERIGWAIDVRRCVALDWLAQCDSQDLVWCNLFLHHFEAEALARLLGAIASVGSVCVAAEPRRGAVAHLAARSLAVIGANAVTRHDAAVSVRAGFRAGELAAMWPGKVLVDRAFGPFSHGFAAASDA